MGVRAAVVYEGSAGERGTRWWIRAGLGFKDTVTGPEDDEQEREREGTRMAQVIETVYVGRGFIEHGPLHTVSAGKHCPLGKHSVLY